MDTFNFSLNYLDGDTLIARFTIRSADLERSSKTLTLGFSSRSAVILTDGDMDRFTITNEKEEVFCEGGVINTRGQSSSYCFDIKVGNTKSIKNDMVCFVDPGTLSFRLGEFSSTGDIAEWEKLITGFGFNEEEDNE